MLSTLHLSTYENGLCPIEDLLRAAVAQLVTPRIYSPSVVAGSPQQRTLRMPRGSMAV
jgi:hypothetical protein